MKNLPEVCLGTRKSPISIHFWKSSRSYHCGIRCISTNFAVNSRTSYEILEVWDVAKASKPFYYYCQLHTLGREWFHQIWVFLWHSYLGLRTWMGRTAIP